MRIAEITEKWSQKYKRSINCAHPKGFSQRAHCAGRKKNEDIEVDEARKGSWNLPDERTETMSLKDLQQHIGLPKMKLIGRNPEFIDNFHTAMSVGVAVGGRFSRRNGFETVDIAHGPMGDSKLRRMVSFHFGLSGRRIAQAVIYNNWNDERHSQGGIKWSYVKTVEHPLDRRENQKLARDSDKSKDRVSEELDYMKGHCHVMALALKELHPDWQIRAHVGWDEEAEDDNDYRIDHVYIVAPDGSAYDCRGKFDNEQELVGQDWIVDNETQFTDYTLNDLKADVARGELKSFTKLDIQKAIKFIKQINL